MKKKEDVDYSLYLVTDSTPAILGGRDLFQVVEAALRGGVGCVQYRDKSGDTAELVATARRLHDITRTYEVPLLINDRVDVALAVGCEGVHIGQDDLDLTTARRLLGPEAIIGVTVTNVDEICRAGSGGADYVGIGTVFATETKQNTKSIIGVDGLQQLLGYLFTSKLDIKSVCIGGINASNADRVMWQSSYKTRALDGVAVVSAIMAAQDAEAASRALLSRVRTPPKFAALSPRAGHKDRPCPDLVALVPDVIRAVASQKPLSHNMTNLVVQNMAANVALAVGASPIMANYGEEARDLASLGGALVINMGTVTPDGIANYLKALTAYNDAARPVVFDPVGAGATAIRKTATRTILGGGYLDVIKGNQSEILACTAHGADIQQHGVDSAPGNRPTEELASIVRDLAKLRKNVVVMTGQTDLVTAGGNVYAIENGHEYLGTVTGTGCCLGTTISAMVAAWPDDKLGAVITALLLYEIASEKAAERDDVKGPGTFVPAFIDELYKIRLATVTAKYEWLERAQVCLVPLRHVDEPD